ncbi:prevent-host-death family protein [Thioalkalivibrio nitratireducens DSM 14787]|uniref:Prevent-host-death family protein n=1 Tax=Thioalkalivibrio nitratireducens (strain DSM 14787 / UNIQEM 213 / ALEN2) TaxID=1255043 RepID=L0DRT6_THIND|nr:prevent-host-death family protein [Thioalkalivibrio nitratireducens DSM 14787]
MDATKRDLTPKCPRNARLDEDETRQDMDTLEEWLASS